MNLEREYTGWTVREQHVPQTSIRDRHQWQENWLSTPLGFVVWFCHFQIQFWLNLITTVLVYQMNSPKESIAHYDTLARSSVFIINEKNVC